MKNPIFIIIAALFLVKHSFSQDYCTRYKVNKDIEIIKISCNSYIHASYAQMPGFGQVASNGLIFTSNGEAVLFDTPVTNSQTKELIEWIEKTLKVKVAAFIPNHWHSDCMGGLAYLNSIGIPSYANGLTIQIANSKKLPAPSNAFKDSLTIEIGGKKIFCYYLGPAHTLDNIVAWIPSERILFGGCMVKELGSTGLGNTADGDIKEYPKTIKKVLNRFSNAKLVIPGHGLYGGVELLEHTLKLSLIK